MRTGEIKALSGLRIFAAVWVVLFHFRPLLEQVAPGFRSAFAPILNCGAQGVDLFFILSGFVLTWNYLDRMGDRWSGRGTLRFLWLRLARVWPVYLVTMHLAAAWIIFTLYVGHVPSLIADQLNAISWVRQILLVQLWFQPFFDGSSWDGPAWSISAEWLAYLLFPLAILVIARLGRATRARGLMVLAVAAALPPILLQLTTGHFYTPWSWLPRIVMQFTAGALACAAIRKLRATERMQRGAGVASIVIGGAIVGSLYLLDAHPVPKISDSSGLVDILFVPFVATLALGMGTLPALLANRFLVYCGHVSFSLYMVHEIIHTAWIWATIQFEILLTPSWTGKAVVAGLVLGAFGAAMLLYHGVEEPARKWMRRMMHVGPAITERETKDPTEPLEPPESERRNVQPIREHKQPRKDDPHSDQVSARAG